MHVILFIHYEFNAYLMCSCRILLYNRGHEEDQEFEVQVVHQGREEDLGVDPQMCKMLPDKSMHLLQLQDRQSTQEVLLPESSIW